MDLTATIAPKSDQLNADDLMAGPITVTIDGVAPGSDEQPVNVHLVERPGRPYRPSKSMRRVLVSAWGPDSSAYAGKRLTLYRNPDTKFGRDVVGGIEISHLSGIGRAMQIPLTVTRGKRRMHTVEPLPDAAPTSYTVPKFHTVEDCRKHWQKRQHEGATQQELDEIRNVAATLEQRQEREEGDQ